MLHMMMMKWFLNVLIAHSALFCNYQSMTTIIDRMKSYQRFCPKQILLSVPHGMVHFNRLKYTANDVAQQYQAEIVDDSFVIQLCTDDDFFSDVQGQ